MVKVPCSGTFYTETYSRNQFGNISGRFPLVDPKLTKRVGWVVNCASATSFSIIEYDDWKSKLMKVFLEVKGIIFWFETGGKWLFKWITLPSPQCYYLGKFPWYWDFYYGMPISPSGKTWTYIPIKAPYLPTAFGIHPPRPPGQIKIFPMEPSVISGEYLPLSVYTREDISFFHGDSGLINLERQVAFLNARELRMFSCRLKMYENPPSFKPKLFKLPD